MCLYNPFTDMRLLKIPALSSMLAWTALGAAPAVHAADASSTQVERVSLTAAPNAPALDSSLPLADRILVRKSERRLFLLRGSSVLRSYHVALGLNPVGQKERSGDFRTPEGNYVLARRNPRSDYFLSIEVSYPNEKDLRRARRNHWNAGGSIMLHGMPNQPRMGPEYYETNDWTDGCIALSDADMLEIWLLSRDSMPIEILP